MMEVGPRTASVMKAALWDQVIVLKELGICTEKNESFHNRYESNSSVAETTILRMQIGYVGL